MPKRKNTSIKEYALKSGKKRFMFQIYLGYNSNGKPIITRRRGFKSYAEAEAAYNKMSQIKADDFVQMILLNKNKLKLMNCLNYGLKLTKKPSSLKVLVEYLLITSTILIPILAIITWIAS